ncbi:Hint domain-containing protein [Corallococcus coralloides]|uniref:Hint domain-containing protein n=1 Tax=Corallococcus coralloides TaxID=184914 RepID=UPI00384FBAE0
MHTTPKASPRNATRLMATTSTATNSTLADQVTALFAAQPVSGDNPVGKAARSALVGRLQGATPGRHSEPYWMPSGQTFLQLFFPNYHADPNQGAVTTATGLNDSWWSSFAVVTLCQAMYNITSNLRPQLKQPDINNQVSASNATLQPKLNALYSQLLRTTPNAVATALAAIPQGQWSQAASLYSSYLSNPAWISAKVAQAASHQWTDQTWELFHHWLKLQLLGMSNASIDALINQLIAAQLPVPASVSAGRWEAYLPWMSPLSLDWNDLKGPATPGILAQVCMTTPGAMWPSCMNEENSFEFTADGQPGNRWRAPPGGSCFLAGAKVLMADGGMKNIEQVHPGDQVRTRSGSAQVLATPTLVLQNEEVYGFNNLGFRFTGTHPFLTLNAASGQGAQLACVQPVDLMNTVPTLSALGIATLEPGCPPLMGWSGDAPTPLPVTSLQAQPCTGATTIHDLVVDFDHQGLSEYIVGDGTTMCVVSSEVPLFGVAPLAASALSSVMSGSWSTVQRTLQAVPADQWEEVLYQGLFTVSTYLLPDAIRAIQGNAPPPPMAAAPPAAMREMARGMASAMTAKTAAGTPTYDNAQGAYFAALTSIFGDEINDAINLGWRSFTPIGDLDATMLAVSVLSLELLADDAIPASESLTLEVQLGRGAAAVTRTLPPFGPLSSASYAQQFDQVLYFDNWRPSEPGTGVDTWTLTFKLRRQDGSALPLRGVTPLSALFEAGYRLCSAAVFTPEGAIVGQVQFDVRPLVPQLMVTEGQARSAWGASQASSFSQQLGTTMGALLAQRFPAAVQPYVPPNAPPP